MKKLVSIMLLIFSLACSAQIDLFNNCPKITWHETVDNMREIFPYSSPCAQDSFKNGFYTALNIENVTFCGVALKGRAVFSKKSHTLARLVFEPKDAGDSPENANMIFGYFRGLLFAKLGAPKILEPYQKKIVYGGKYEWKRDNVFISVDLFSGDNYSRVSLMLDSQDWETLCSEIQRD